MIIPTLKLSLAVIPGFIIGEAVGIVINEKTTIPLSIAGGIAMGVIGILFPLLWRIASKVQSFKDTQENTQLQMVQISELIKSLQQSSAQLQKSFDGLYCVKNAECLRTENYK